MQLINIRHPEDRVSFREAVLTGLGRNQGLFFPERFQRLPNVDELLQLDFVSRSVAVLEHLVGDEFAAGRLQVMVESAFDFPLRWAMVAIAATLWKPLYYAPNTMAELVAHRRRECAGDLFATSNFLPTGPSGRALWLRCWLPYLVLHFGLLPLPFLLIGPEAWVAALINRGLAELLTNVHAFVVIVPTSTQAFPALMAWRTWNLMPPGRMCAAQNSLMAALPRCPSPLGSKGEGP